MALERILPSKRPFAIFTREWPVSRVYEVELVNQGRKTRGGAPLKLCTETYGFVHVSTRNLSQFWHPMVPMEEHTLKCSPFEKPL